MYDRPAVAALRDSLASVVESHPVPLDTEHHRLLKERVCAVVDDLKVAGWPPERVIVAVKQVATDAGLSPSRGVLNGATALNERDGFIVEMVRWCIERYYRHATPSS
jgi:hypothetical protein